MNRIFDLGFRNKIEEGLVCVMGIIFSIGTFYSNIILAYIFVFSFFLFILLLVFPFDKIKQVK